MNKSAQDERPGFPVQRIVGPSDTPMADAAIQRKNIHGHLVYVRLDDARKIERALRAEAGPKWEGGRELQRDSHATGRPQVHAWLDREKKRVTVHLTDGACSWALQMPLPKEWSP